MSGKIDEKDFKTAVAVYAHYLGIDVETERNLVFIAEDALHNLPRGWDHGIGEDEHAGIPYFFNNKTGQSVWKHPEEAIWIRKVKEEKLLIKNRNQKNDKTRDDREEEDRRQRQRQEQGANNSRRDLRGDVDSAEQDGRGITGGMSGEGRRMGGGGQRPQVSVDVVKVVEDSSRLTETLTSTTRYFSNYQRQFVHHFSSIVGHSNL